MGWGQKDALAAGGSWSAAGLGLPGNINSRPLRAHRGRLFFLEVTMAIGKYPSEIQDAAMKIWVQGNRPTWTEVARRVNEAFNVSVKPHTVKSWYEKEIPMNWEEFEKRYKAKIYMSEAERLADEAAEVREHTWRALRAMFSKMADDMVKWKTGELEMKYRSADGFVNAFLKVIQAYYNMFGDNEQYIKALLEKMPKDELAEFRDMITSGAAKMPEA